MKDNTPHHDLPEQTDIFEQFSAESRPHVQEIWEKSEHISLKQPQLSSDDVDNAWASVNARIRAGETSQSNWKWMAAAAAILLIAGAAFLLIPKTITAPNGEMIAVTLPDGSSVELNSGTQLQYNRLFGYTNRTLKLDGEAYFSVKESNHVFIVNAHATVIEVTGTKFNIKSRQQTIPVTDVTVSEGQVRFYKNNNSGRAVTVSAGQSSTMGEQMETPTPPKKAVIERVLGWRSHKLVFDDASLRTIFNELERRFNIHIQLQNSGLARQTLTAYYADPRNAESVIKDICRVKGLQYSETANGYRVYK